MRTRMGKRRWARATRNWTRTGPVRRWLALAILCTAISVLAARRWSGAQWQWLPRQQEDARSAAELEALFLTRRTAPVHDLVGAVAARVRESRDRIFGGGALQALQPRVRPTSPGGRDARASTYASLSQEPLELGPIPEEERLEQMLRALAF